MPNAAERGVFDASPLIVLAKAGRLTLVEDPTPTPTCRILDT